MISYHPDNEKCNEGLGSNNNIGSDAKYRWRHIYIYIYI